MAVDLGSATGKIVIDTRDLSRVAIESQKVGGQVEKNLGRIGASAGKVQTSIQGVSFAARQMLATFGVTLGAAALARLFSSSSKAASDLTESISKTTVAFSTSDAAILEWSKNSVDALGQSRQQALEAASTFGLLFSTMGLAPEASSDMSMALVQLATDMASINNISVDEALIKLRAGLVGEVEPLRTVGVLLNAATVEAKAMEMGLANSTGAISEQNKVMARYQLILEQTKLTQGDFARTIDGLANRQRIAQAAAGDAQAAFGEIIQEDVIEMTNVWTNALIALTTQIKKARDAAGGESLGTALLQMGGWKLPGQKAREDEAKEIAVLTGFLDKAQEGLVRLQEQFAQGIVDQSAVTRQIVLIRELEQAILDAGRAGRLVQVGIYQRDQFLNPTSRGASSTPITPARFSGPEGEAQLDAIRDRWTAITAIERTSGAAIVESTRQYSEQRANTIRDYEQGIAREAADYARGRERAEAAHLRQLEDLRSSAARREASMAAELARVNGQAAADSAARVAEWTAEHGRAVADAREASSARLVKLEEDYNRDRQRAAQDSRERLMNAAGRLDAAAVFAEQRRAAQEAKRAEENHQERVESEQESLQTALDNLNETHAKRIDDEAKALERSTRQRQEAYDRQLEDAREADAQREQDMIEDFEQRKELEDEDRAIRLGRMAEDHQDRLNEMARQHAIDLEQIATNAAAERKQAEDDHNKAMAAAGVHNAAWIAKNKLLTDAAIADYDRVTAAMGRMINTLQGPLERNPYITPGEYPSLTGGSTSSSSASITIAPGAIVINATPYQSPQDIGDEVRNALYEVLEEMQ